MLTCCLCSAAVAVRVFSVMQQLPKVLPLETLKTFHELGVEPPATNEDVPKTIAGMPLGTPPGTPLGSDWGRAWHCLPHIY
jgi:hypothetical protein